MSGLEKFLLTFLLLLNSFSSVISQQLPSLNQYYLNTYLINPAYAGNSGYTDVMMIYRKQWVGVPGAPETSLLSADWALKSEKAGLGFIFTNDRNNILSKTSGYGTFSYRIKLSKYQKLFMGASIGFMNTNIDFDQIRAQDPGEAAFFQYPNQKTVFDANAGIAYQYKSFRIGLSAMQLPQITTSFESVYDKKHLNFGLVRHYQMLLEYSYTLNDHFRVVPMILIRSVQGISPSAEINATLYYKKNYWLNVNYRYKDLLGLSFGFVIDKRFAVCYTYELPPFSHLGGISTGSHEFALKFRFVSPNGRAKTGYEFIDNTITYIDPGVTEEEKQKNAKPLPKQKK